MVDFAKSIKLPFTDFGSLAIGAALMAAIDGILLLLGILLGIWALFFRDIVVWTALLFIFIAASFVLSFVFSGYSVRIAHNAIIKKNSVLPKWADWNGLLGDGFKVSLVYLAYFAIPAVILIIGTVMYFARIIPYISVDTLSQQLFMALGITSNERTLLFLGLALLLFVSFFTYMAMLSFASKRKLKDAFNLKQVFIKSMKGGYFLGFMFLFAYTLALSLAGAAASVAGGFLIGRVVSYIVSMIALATITDALGQAYAEN
jgi:hypothetical protein